MSALIRLAKLVPFLLFYAKEVVVANLQIAWQVVRPDPLARPPGFVEISVEGLDDLQLLVVTNLITMTPGTLSFDVSPDRRRVLIHQLLPGGNREDDRRRFEESYVRRVREIF